MCERCRTLDLRALWLTEVKALLDDRCEQLRRAAEVEMSERLKGQDLEDAEDERR